MQKECSISLRLYFLLFTVLLTSITFSQTVPAAPTSGGDSALARHYRDCSEVCDIAEIPKYVQLTLQTVRPHLTQAVITNESKNYYAAIAATAINNLGFYFEHEGNRNEALRFLKFAAFLQKTIGDSKSLAVTLSNLGSVYETGGDVKQAIAHYYNSLKIREKINDLQGIANVTHNLSNLHFSVGNIEVASDYSKRALLKRRQLRDTSGVAFSYENLAILAAEQFDTASAINYYNTAAKAFERFGRKEYFASALVCEGTAKHFQRDFITARNNFEQAIAIYAEQNQLVQASSVYNRLSDVERYLRHFSKAILYAEKAKELG